MRYLLLALPLSLLAGCYYPYGLRWLLWLLDPLCAGLFGGLCTRLPAGLRVQLRATDLCASLPGSSVIVRWRELRHS